MTDSDSSTARPGMFARLRAGLSRTATQLSGGLTDVLMKQRLDADAIRSLEDALIRADLGTALAAEVTADVAKGRYDMEISERELKKHLSDSITRYLLPVAEKFVPDPRRKPFVILVAGVNGTGKTTTIGKLAGGGFSGDLGRRKAAGSAGTGLFEQDFLFGTGESFQTPGQCRGGFFAQPARTLFDRNMVKLRHFLRRRSIARTEGKYVQIGEGCLIDEPQRVFELRFGFGWKTGDQIRTESSFRPNATHLLAKADDVVTRVAALHAFQDQIVASLHRDMKMRHQPLFFRDKTEQDFIDFRGINGRQPQPG